MALLWKQWRKRKKEEEKKENEIKGRRAGRRAGVRGGMWVSVSWTRVSELQDTDGKEDYLDALAHFDLQLSSFCHLSRSH